MQVRQEPGSFLNQEQISQSPPQDCSDTDIFQILTSVLIAMARGEQVVQCIREVLVQDDTFTPMNLFRYLSKDSRQISSQNILDFLEANNSLENEKQTLYILTRVFAKYGITNLANIQYTQFLCFIYPQNTGVLREIGVNRIKNYPQIDRHLKGLRPLDSVLIGFLSLLQQEIETQKKIEIQLLDQRFPNRDKLRKVIKSIKQASQKMCTTITEKSDNTISMLELRNFIKAFLDVPEHLFLYLSRRLGINKSGLIPLANIEQALKKSKKHQYWLGVSADKENRDLEGQNMVKFTNSGCREQKEQMYREQLYKELAQTLKTAHKGFSNTPRRAMVPTDRYHKSYGLPARKSKSRNKTPQRRNKQIRPIEDFLMGRDSHPTYNQQCQNINLNQTDAYWSQLNTGNHQKVDGHDQNKAQLKEQHEQMVSDVREPKYAKVSNIFKKYVEYFLNGHKQIEQCRDKVSKLKVDYLSLFKSLDEGRGAIDSVDLRKLYVMLSGIPTDYDFQLIVDRFAQPDQKWLSYSEFADLFRSNTCSNPEKSLQSLRNASLKTPLSIEELQPEAIRGLAQIIYLNLDLEHNLRQIASKLQQSELEWLFYRINSDSDSKGFINYQQLKKYLTDQLQMSVTMMDLMALLKRFDKSKNGVVLKEEFVLI